MKPNIAISYSITENFDVVKDYWRRKQHSDSSAVFPSDVSLGGLLDISSHSYEYNQPYGFCISDVVTGSHAIVSAKDNVLYVYDGKNTTSITNNAFNDLHDVVTTTRGYLVLSSGLDCILEIDYQGNVLWSYYALFDSVFRERFSLTPLSISELYKNKFDAFEVKNDWRSITIETKNRIAHMNTITLQRDTGYKGDHERYLWVTAYHQGIVLKVDREKGTSTVAMDGLKRPHSIHEHENFWTVVDTGKQDIYILDKSAFVNGSAVKIVNIIHINNSKWIQDATMDSENKLYILDSTNSVIHIYSVDGKRVDSIPVNISRRAQRITVI